MKLIQKTFLRRYQMKLNGMEILCELINQSICQSNNMNSPISQSINLSLNQYSNQSCINHAVDYQSTQQSIISFSGQCTNGVTVFTEKIVSRRWFHHQDTIKWSFNQSTDQSLSITINRSINQIFS